MTFNLDNATTNNSDGLTCAEHVSYNKGYVAGCNLARDPDYRATLNDETTTTEAIGLIQGFFHNQYTILERQQPTPWEYMVISQWTPRQTLTWKVPRGNVGVSLMHCMEVIGLSLLCEIEVTETECIITIKEDPIDA